MAPTLKAVSDSELVEESRRKFTVLQAFIKGHIKNFCNDGEETDDGIYEAIEDWRENTYYFYAEFHLTHIYPNSVYSFNI